MQLEVEVEKDLPMIRFDEAQLKQVFLNILTNAFDAVEERSEKCVTVVVRLIKENVSVMVSDSGIGFADPEHVFDPFFSTKGVSKGSGLGLSVCYGIVRQHGGNIRAHNLSPSGSCITVEFPLAQQELALASGS